MPGIPSKDASFVRETPRNYALTSDEKVVEFLPDCNKFLHMILIIFSGKAFYNIINFQRIFFVMIYDNGHFLCRFFCLSCLF